MIATAIIDGLASISTLFVRKPVLIVDITIYFTKHTIIDYLITITSAATIEVK